MTLKVAVIGAGPAGLVVPRWLLSQGFEPLIFERSGTRRSMDRTARPKRRVAGHTYQHQPNPDCVQRPAPRG